MFAPWRMDWVTREDTNEGIDGCVFCELPEADTAQETHIMVRSDHSYVLLNKAPYTPGHVLVIPHSHAGSLIELKTESIHDVFFLTKQTMAAIKNALRPDGFNIGMNIGKAGGASIEDHVHLHVVPRWHGDTTFMPITANTKIIAEALDETYERLRTAFTQLDDDESFEIE
jgi:ATP adenylyltransferase